MPEHITLASRIWLGPEPAPPALPTEVPAHVPSLPAHYPYIILIILVILCIP